ncbi:putative membrane-bound metal-dependent hydrolase [Bacillus phage vB_BceM-HSE3]|nr:putative membrane-bound metal-dependent hydrolase [Bacillus phage vB_BceM-HSE3]
MNYKNHAISSVGVGVALQSIALMPVTASFQIPYLAGVLIGSQLPDLDHPSSHIGYKTYGFLFSKKTRNKIARKTHRKFTHYIETWLVLGGLGCLFLVPWMGWAFSIGLFVGYGGHLLGDSMTPWGIPSLLLGTKHWRVPFKFLHFKSDSAKQPLVAYAMLGVGALIYYLRLKFGQ